MTIFNNSNHDVDNSIIFFMPIRDQINLSGVNNTAYYVLSNDHYFKQLFIEKYPCFKETLGQLFLSRQFNSLRMSFEYIGNNFSTNCWKISCFVLQTGNVKFKDSFLQELFATRLNHLIMLQNHLESRLINICGSLYGEPSSPICQAWKCYQENVAIISLCEEIMERVFPSDYQKERVGKGEDAWQGIASNIEPDTSDWEAETAISHMKIALAAFDEHLIPVSHLKTTLRLAKIKADESLNLYNQLESQRSHIEQQLTQINKYLHSNMDPINQQKNLLEEHAKLSKSFKEILKQQLDISLSSSQRTPEDIKTIYAAFKNWAAVAYPYELLLALKHIWFISPNSTAVTDVRAMFSMELFSETINQFVSRPMQHLTPENIQSKISEIHECFLIPLNTIENFMAEAIKERHGVTIHFNSLLAI